MQEAGQTGKVWLDSSKGSRGAVSLRAPWEPVSFDPSHPTTSWYMKGAPPTRDQEGNDICAERTTQAIEESIHSQSWHSTDVAHTTSENTTPERLSSPSDVPQTPGLVSISRAPPLHTRLVCSPSCEDWGDEGLRSVAMRV